MRRLSLVVLLVLASLALLADPNSMPRAHGLPVLPVESLAIVNLPPLDVVRLMAEDDANAGRPVPYRIGVSSEVHGVLRDGTLEALPDGGSLWRLAIRSAGAPWMSVVLDGLPSGTPGLEIRFHAPDASFVAGPIAGASIAPSGVLASPMVPGDTVVIEVYRAAGGEAMPAFGVRSAVAGYRFMGPGRGSGACNIDINCPQGAEWQSDKRAEAMIYLDGGICSGTLINNVRGDCRNYFLTANHCIHKDDTAQGTVFYWNYEWTGCGDGELLFGDWQSGSTLRAMNPKSDFTLLELNTPIDPAYKLYYAGWNADPTPAHGAVGIHHPSGDVKKISFEYNDLVSSNAYGVDAWRVPNWDLGVTEGGSSGSGLWNSSHQIIGQLFGGESACGNSPARMNDDYGKFSASWGNGGSAALRLKDWLDPDATGTLSIAGKDSASCGASISAHVRPLERP